MSLSMETATQAQPRELEDKPGELNGCPMGTPERKGDDPFHLDTSHMSRADRSREAAAYHTKLANEALMKNNHALAGAHAALIAAHAARETAEIHREMLAVMKGKGND